MSLNLRFLTRPGCQLCDQARPVVERAAARAGAIVEEVDVDADEELAARYGSRIPVVVGPDDEVLAEGMISDGRRLRREFRRSARRGRG